jgi:hypothetical protein
MVMGISFVAPNREPGPKGRPRGVFCGRRREFVDFAVCGFGRAVKARPLFGTDIDALSRFRDSEFAAAISSSRCSLG